jgi:DHA2 family multidrug resistance protein
MAKTTAIPSDSKPTAAIAAAGAHQDELYKYRWLILLGLVTAAIMEVLDTTIVNVALPQMAGNLGVTNQEIGWVSTGYILSNVVVLPMTAFLTLRFGRKNYLIFSIILFIGASFFCGTSHSLGELVFWRICQGAGGAALLSTGQATLLQVFPKEQLGVVQSMFILGIIVAPTLGPALGGWITDNYNWNWCFFINIPIGLLSAFLVFNYLTDPPNARVDTKIDYLGIGLLAVGLGSLQYLLEEGQQNDWFQDPTMTRIAVLSGVSLLAMIWWELSPRNTAPVVAFKVLRNRQLSASIALFIALGFGLYGGVYLYPLFTQEILGFTPTETGLALLPGGLATAFFVLVCGAILSDPKHRVDPRLLIYIGMGLFIYSMWEMGHMTSSSGIDDTRNALIVRGAGLGFLFTPLNQLSFSSVDPKDAQQASGLINLGRQLGGSFGIAILGTYITSHTAFHLANLVHYVNPGNIGYAPRMQAMQGVLMGHGLSAEAAKHGSVGLLDAAVTRQATTMSYDDGFLLILLVFVACVPAILILRRPKPGAGAPAGAGH